MLLSHSHLRPLCALFYRLNCLTMQLVNFILGSFSLLIQQYADYYQEQNLADTLTQLNNDLGLPCIQTYDYIVGNWILLSFLSCQICAHFVSSWRRKRRMHRGVKTIGKVFRPPPRKWG